MNIVTSLQEWRKIRKNLDKMIGFIPTMGHLHEGHLSLCERAKRETDITVVSIFVNPAQFNETQDFERYPRDLEADRRLLEQAKVDFLLAPSAHEIYPDQYQIQIMETELSQVLEGKFRPGHFNGMLTVVLKLLNLVQADLAYFGEKDYQQLLLIEKMVKAFFLDVQIVACQTVRDQHGLALSSRNARLNAEQKIKAASLHTVLKTTSDLKQAIDALNQIGFKVDYVEEKWQRRLAAVWLDEVRLIDNILLDKKEV